MRLAGWSASRPLAPPRRDSARRRSTSASPLASRRASPGRALRSRAWPTQPATTTTSIPTIEGPPLLGRRVQPVVDVLLLGADDVDEDAQRRPRHDPREGLLMPHRDRRRHLLCAPSRPSDDPHHGHCQGGRAAARPARDDDDFRDVAARARAHVQHAAEAPPRRVDGDQGHGHAEPPTRLPDATKGRCPRGRLHAAHRVQPALPPLLRPAAAPNSRPAPAFCGAQETDHHRGAAIRRDDLCAHEGHPAGLTGAAGPGGRRRRRRGEPSPGNGRRGVSMGAKDLKKQLTRMNTKGFKDKLKVRMLEKPGAVIPLDTIFMGARTSIFSVFAVAQSQLLLIEAPELARLLESYPAADANVVVTAFESEYKNLLDSLKMNRDGTSVRMESSRDSRVGTPAAPPAAAAAATPKC